MIARDERPVVSVLVPLYNEAANVLPLYRELGAVLDELGCGAELLLVDDGSTDGTGELLEQLAAADGRVSCVRLARNFGQTAALQAGFDRARGRIVVTMDGDLQNDPRDVPALLQELERTDADIVSGWRRERRDTWWSRRLPSVLANRLIRWTSGVHIRDNGCALKAYRREVVERAFLYSDMHRLIVPFLTMTGARYREIPVHHRPRRAGASKYGIGRTWKVVLDLLVLLMITRFANRPGGWFTLLAIPFAALALASLIASLAGYLTAAPGADLAIVLPGATLLFGFAVVHLLLLGIAGETVVWTGDFREQDVALLEVDGGDP